MNAEVVRAEVELAKADPVLASLIVASGPCPIGTGKRHRTNFEALARSIVFQQLAGKAALAIWNRTLALLPGPISAPAVLAVGEERLRTAGLSGSKVKALLDLSDRVVTGDVKLASIVRRRADEVVAELSRVWGVGRWTAEMFLMFQLGRLDVWPTGDLGVRNGFARAWSLPEVPVPAALEDLGERFRPWRSARRSTGPRQWLAPVGRARPWHRRP